MAVHFAIRYGRTLCQEEITTAKDPWGHSLTFSGEPITTYPCCVNCETCKERIPQGEYVCEDGPFIRITQTVGRG